MSKYLFILIISSSSLKLIAQFNPIGFEDYVPKWTHYFQDSAAINFYEDHSDGMTHLEYDPKIININDSILYVIYNILVKTLSGDGGYIEKLDIHKKEMSWSNYFDFRNIDKLETPANFFINGFGNIEVVGYRKSDNSFFTKKSKFFRREYAVENGKLLSHFFSPESDTLAPWMYASSGWGVSQLFPFNNDSYIHTSAFSFYPETDPYSNTINYILNTQGQKINQRLYNSEQYFKYNLVGSRFFLMSNKEYLNTLYSINTTNTYVDTFKYKLFIQYFNDSMEFKKSFEITNDISIKDGATFEIVYVDKEFVVVKVWHQYEPLNWRTNFYFFNHKGELKDDQLFITTENMYVNYMDVIRMDNDNFLFAGCSQWQQKGSHNKIYFYSKKIGEEMFPLMEFTLNKENHFVALEKLLLLTDNSVIYFGRHGYSTFNGDDFIDNHGGGWKLMIHFDQTDIGLGATNINLKEKENENAQKVKIFPNPVFDILNIDTEQHFDKMMIYDLLGNMILFSDYSEHIYLEDMQSGMYLIKLIDENVTKAVIPFVKD